MSVVVAHKQVSIALAPELADQLPSDAEQRREVLELGLREWRIRQALEAFRRGEGSLAFAAEQAGITLREMIPLAYAHGLEPRVSPQLLGQDSLSLKEAADV